MRSINKICNRHNTKVTNNSKTLWLSKSWIKFQFLIYYNINLDYRLEFPKLSSFADWWGGGRVGEGMVQGQAVGK